MGRNLKVIRFFIFPIKFYSKNKRNLQKAQYLGSSGLLNRYRNFFYRPSFSTLVLQLIVGKYSFFRMHKYEKLIFYFESENILYRFEDFIYFIKKKFMIPNKN